MPIRKSTAFVLVFTAFLSLSLYVFANGMLTERVPGSCKDFNRFLADKGAKAKDSDPDTKREPKRAGVTRATIETVKGIQTTRRRTPDGQYCSTVSFPDFPFTLTQSSRILEWKPSSSPSAACSRFIDQWTQAVEDHERSHLAANIDYVQKQKAQWQPLKFDKCEQGTPPAVFTETDRQVIAEAKDALDKMLDSMTKDIQKLSDDFHQTDRGGPTRPLDCSVCKVAGD